MRLAPQFFRFVIIGGLATAVQYVLLVVLVHAGMHAVLASSIGFAISAVVNYLLNRRFTFGVEVKHARALPRFLLVALSGLACNGLLLALFVGPAGLHFVPAQLIATAGTLVWNFVLHRAWTFTHPKSL